MIEGIKNLYSGEDAFLRHISLFSICGIIGLFEAYIGIFGIDSLYFSQKICYLVLWLFFMFFLTGYEVVFLHKRELPDINFESIKPLFCKYIFLVFLAGIPLFLMRFFYQYAGIAFIIEMILAVPLTTIQAGYSYNFKESEVFSLFKKLTYKNYAILFLKRLLVILSAYIITFFIVFVIFFVSGFLIALFYKGNIDITLNLSSQLDAITKLAVFLSGIILMYTLTIATLVWDYELIKSYED